MIADKIQKIVLEEKQNEKHIKTFGTRIGIDDGARTHFLRY